MPDPQIRKWTLRAITLRDQDREARPAAVPEKWYEPIRVVEAAPVIAALHQIEAAIHIGKGLALHEVQELRRAVSDE